MSEPTEQDEIFLVIDDLNYRSRGDLVQRLAIELDISNEEALTYVKDYINNGLY